MSDKVKVGVIGAGQIGLAHIAGFKSSPKAEVIAVCDASPERLSAAAQKYGVPQTFSDYQALLAVKEIDAVSIALPNYLHAPACLAALKAGKHVCCEKPFAM
ncbi:MAG: Gfo/Idh/MocA family oxidoreductase, partial [Planctomycetes bacterium]|nr:Gfo/Idh/MocA family oxidoreductase [Planctomycetota bacterium]